MNEQEAREAYAELLKNNRGTPVERLLIALGALAGLDKPKEKAPDNPA